MKKDIKNVLFLVILGSFLFKGALFREAINYREIHDRSYHNEELAALGSGLANSNSLLISKDDNMKEIALKVQKMIAKKLTFNIAGFDEDSLLSMTEKIEGNCKDYAALFCYTFNELSRITDLSDISCSQKQGKLTLFGCDVHRCFEDRRWKNHDYNELYDNRTGETLKIDCSLYDYLGIEYVN